MTFLDQLRGLNGAIDQLIADVRKDADAAKAIISDLITGASMPSDAKPNEWPTLAHLRFDAPVGTNEERAGSKLWPGAWHVTMDYAESYPPAMNRKDFHTGVDLNLPNFGDTGQPVCACANGDVVFAGSLSEWGLVVVVHHVLTLEGIERWSRYAHLANIAVSVGQNIERGHPLAVIGQYGRPGPQDDHLHFDIARIDLGKRPADWPNMDKARLLRDYESPLEFVKARHHD